MSFYGRIATSPGGSRRIAQARLVYAVAKAQTSAERCNEEAQKHYAALSWSDRRKLRRHLPPLRALAGYLHDLGFELVAQVVPAGQPRATVLADRAEVERLRQRVADLERKPRCGRTEQGMFDDGTVLGPCVMDHGHEGMHEEEVRPGRPAARWAAPSKDEAQETIRRLTKERDEARRALEDPATFERLLSISRARYGRRNIHDSGEPR